jgi:hypothetical protein
MCDCPCCCPNGVPRNAVFDPDQPGADDVSVSLAMFKSIERENPKTGKVAKVMALVPERATYAEIARRVVAHLPAYMQHSFRYGFLRTELANAVKNLQEWQIWLDMDFSMNPTSPVDREIQSLFFYTQSCSLLAVIAEFYENGVRQKIVFHVFSEYKRHTPGYVEAALDAVEEYLCPGGSYADRGITEVLRGCDGGTHFRSIGAIEHTARRAEKSGMPHTTFFSETGHGKGPHDGLMAHAKLMFQLDCQKRWDGLGADQSLATSSLGLAAAFAAFVNTHLNKPAAANGPAHKARCETTKRVGLCLQTSACEHYDGVADPTAKSMPDTLKTHAVHVATDGTITKSQMYCGCLECIGADDAPPCPNFEYCGEWLPFSTKYGGGGGRVEKAQLRLAHRGARGGAVLRLLVDQLDPSLELAVTALAADAWVAVRSEEPDALYALMQLFQAPSVSGTKPGRRPSVGGATSAPGTLIVCGRLSLVMAGAPEGEAVVVKARGKPVNMYAADVLLADVQLHERAAGGRGPKLPVLLLSPEQHDTIVVARGAQADVGGEEVGGEAQEEHEEQQGEEQQGEEQEHGAQEQEGS